MVIFKKVFGILRSYFTWSGCHATAVGDPAQPEQSWRSSSGSHPGAHQELGGVIQVNVTAAVGGLSGQCAGLKLDDLSLNHIECLSLFCKVI